MQTRPASAGIAVMNQPNVSCDMRFEHEEVTAADSDHLWRWSRSRKTQPVRREVQ